MLYCGSWPKCGLLERNAKMLNWRQWTVVFMTMNNGESFDIECWNGNIAFSDKAVLYTQENFLGVMAQ